jgi:hypothetical protein
VLLPVSTHEPVVVAELDDADTEMRVGAAARNRAAIRRERRRDRRRRPAPVRPSLALIRIRRAPRDCRPVCGHRVAAGELLARRHGAWVCADCRLIDKERAPVLTLNVLRWLLAPRQTTTRRRR